MTRLRPHPFLWLHRKVSEWWPFLVSLAAICLIVTMAWVGWTVASERAYFEAEQARDRRQDQQMAALIEELRQEDDTATEHVAEALRQAEALLRDQFAAHDANIAAKLNELLAQIAALHDRPIAAPVTPSSARSADEPTPARTPPPTFRPAPQPASTTTTTVVQVGGSDLCERRPDAPPCKEPR